MPELLEPSRATEQPFLSSGRGNAASLSQTIAQRPSSAEVRRRMDRVGVLGI